MLPKHFDTLFWFYTCPGKFTSARKTKHFIGLFMTAVDRIKCRYAHSGVTSALRYDKQSRRFSNSRGLSASVSFLSSPPPPRLLGPFFARSLTLETARKRLLRRLQRITHFCYRRTIRLKQENFSCNDKTNYTTRHKFITHKNNCCQVFSRSRNDQPLFVNEYKVNVG